jgi:hypothetical protein
MHTCMHGDSPWDSPRDCQTSVAVRSVLLRGFDRQCAEKVSECVVVVLE